MAAVDLYQDLQDNAINRNKFSLAMPIMPIIVKNAWQQKSWWATMGLMGKRTKNLFLDMKKLVRKEVRSSSGTSIIDPLPLRALHKSLAQLPKIGILTILRQD